MGDLVGNRIRLFIIDDHKIVVHGIQLILRDQVDIRLVGYAHTGAEAKAELANLKVDVVIQDIQLPDEDGIELTKFICKKYPGVEVIGLTSYTEVSFIAELLRAGAKGYLFKDTSEEELLRAVRTVYIGHQYLSAEVNKKMLNRVIHKKSIRKSFIPKLTRREKEVLELVIQECTNHEIASRLYLSVSTIEKHRINLGIKLDARNAIGLYKKAIKFGLLD